MDHNIGRAAHSLEGHHGSLFFYPLALLIGFFPWSVFAVPVSLEVVRRIRQRDAQWAGVVLAVCWIGVYVGLFSMAKTKLPSYITPCYPAAALLVSNFVVAWMQGKALSGVFWPRAALMVLAVVGIVIVVAVPLVTVRVLPGEQWLGLLGVIPLATATIALAYQWRGVATKAAFVFAAGAVLLTTSLFAVGAARVGGHQTFDTFVAAIQSRSPHATVGTLGVLEPSWVFYVGQPLDHLFAPELLNGVSEDTPRLGAPQAQLGREALFECLAVLATGTRSVCDHHGRTARADWSTSRGCDRRGAYALLPAP